MNTREMYVTLGSYEELGHTERTSLTFELSVCMHI